MRWDFFVEHWKTRLEADTGAGKLVSIMGSASGWFGPGQATKPVTIPSIEYTRIYDTEDELFNKIGVQVDVWARGLAKAKQIERRVRLVTHQDAGQVLGGERVWMRYQDGRTLDYPADPGVIHQVLDFEFEALREKYVTM